MENKYKYEHDDKSFKYNLFRKEKLYLCLLLKKFYIQTFGHCMHQNHNKFTCFSFLAKNFCNKMAKPREVYLSPVKVRNYLPNIEEINEMLNQKREVSNQKL